MVTSHRSLCVVLVFAVIFTKSHANYNFTRGINSKLKNIQNYIGFNYLGKLKGSSIKQTNNLDHLMACDLVRPV